MIIVILALMAFGNPRIGEDVSDFPDRQRAPTSGLNAVTQSVLGRCDRIILAVGGARETVNLIALKGTRNDATHPHGVHEFRSDLTNLIEAL